MADKMAVLVMVVMLGALALKAVAWQSGRARTGFPERPTLASPNTEETTAINNDNRLPTGANKFSGRIGVFHIDVGDYDNHTTPTTPNPSGWSQSRNNDLQSVRTDAVSRS